MCRECSTWNKEKSGRVRAAKDSNDCLSPCVRSRYSVISSQTQTQRCLLIAYGTHSGH